MTHAPRLLTLVLFVTIFALASCSGEQQTATNETSDSSPGEAATTDAEPGLAAIDPATVDHSALLAIPLTERTAEQDYLLGRHYAVRAQADEAFESLADALLKGFKDTSRLTGDEALQTLHEDSRWEQVLIYTETNRSAPPQRTQPRRAQTQPRTRPPAARTNVPAPDWTLSDAKGLPVRISDFRGKVVIMDFWATWCGPCKAAMPEIDRFVRENAGDDVIVLSVNVWERGRQPQARNQALAWYNDQGYAMKVVFGDRDLTTAYGVQGIPHLTVIDQDGIIRQAQSGYHPRLREDLIRWTRELTSAT